MAEKKPKASDLFGYVPMTPEEESEWRIGDAVQKIVSAFADLRVDEAAQVCLRAGVIRKTDADMAGLAKFRLLEDLSKESPDPRNLKLASELGMLDRGERTASTLSISIVPHRVRDDSLSRIISECDEIVLKECADALAVRVEKLSRTEQLPLLTACRGLLDALSRRFVGAKVPIKSVR